MRSYGKLSGTITAVSWPSKPFLFSFSLVPVYLGFSPYVLWIINLLILWSIVIELKLGYSVGTRIM